MADDVSTIIAALIGALGGSLSATIVNNLLTHRADRMALRESLVNRYLLQVQDAVETLWNRFDNIKEGGGGERLMEDSYYEVSTLYALACVLAYKRILLLDGVYSQLDEQLGKHLKKKMQEFDFQLSTLQFLSKFFYYDRLALAEAVIEREDNHLRTCTYMDFKKQYLQNGGELKLSLKAAKNFVSSFRGSNVLNGPMDRLMEISILLDDKAGVASSIRSRG